MNSNENPHEPLVERALVSFDLAAEHHIAHCQPCQTEREKVEDALRQFGAANREYANRPTSFYEQQAARIRAAQQESRQKSRLTMTLVPSLVVLVLLAHAGVTGLRARWIDRYGHGAAGGLIAATGLVLMALGI